MASQEVPPPPEGAGSRPDWADDESARAETIYWDNEATLRGVEIGNNILWTKVYGWIVAIMMVFFALVFCASLAAWICHYITPWNWLKPEQLSKIQSVIFSGSLGALVSAYAQKHMAKI